MKPLYSISVCIRNLPGNNIHTHCLSYSEKTMWTVVSLFTSLVTGHLLLVAYESNLCTGKAQPNQKTVNCSPEMTLILTEILRDTLSP